MRAIPLILSFVEIAKHKAQGEPSCCTLRCCSVLYKLGFVRKQSEGFVLLLPAILGCVIKQSEGFVLLLPAILGCVRKQSEGFVLLLPAILGCVIKQSLGSLLLLPAILRFMKSSLHTVAACYVRWMRKQSKHFIFLLPAMV